MNRLADNNAVACDAGAGGPRLGHGVGTPPLALAHINILNEIDSAADKDNAGSSKDICGPEDARDALIFSLTLARRIWRGWGLHLARVYMVQGWQRRVWSAGYVKSVVVDGT